LHFWELFWVVPPFLIGNVLLCEAALYKVAEQCIQHRDQRDKKQYSQDAQQVSAQRYCSQNPDRGKSYRVADDMWIDEISFDLLNNQEQNDEQKCFPGVGDGNEQRAYAAADESATMGISAINAIRTPISRT